MKFKKGNTILEILLAASIFFFFSGAFIAYSYFLINSLKKVDNEYTETYMLSFINNSRQYCRKEKNDGDIQFDILNDTVYFIQNDKIIDTFNLPKDFKLVSVSSSNNRNYLHVDEKGYIGDACTIKYMDKDKEIHRITISVGSSYVEIK